MCTRRKRIRPLWSLVPIVFFATGALALDSDQDGVDDAVDNCQLAANSDQRDTDNDGYGNLCDADLSNDNIVNAIDLGLLRLVFHSSEPHADPLAEHADMNGDGVVNVVDLGLFRQAFLLPPGPAGNTVIDADAAARFLAQATFGARSDEIAALVTLGDYEAWIDLQIAAPISQHHPLTLDFATRMCFEMPVIDAWYRDARLAAWWEISLNGPDQLRQRTAFALSQILVVGDTGEMLNNSQFAVADYYDTLADGAFGNYRDLLENVTLHAAMGMYLSSVQNERAQPELNIRPDENFAREIMQLFTIGVQLLNIDGTAKLDANGQPIATYAQVHIEEFARIYTGWSYANQPWWQWYSETDRTLPMQAFEEYHDVESKSLFGISVSGGRSAYEDLTIALDILFAHPNVGPFVARRLIQRLATSNPSPGYVARVAQAFNDDGTGVRGDLAAVVKTILLDPEARTGHVYIPEQFGKLREPLLRLSHVRRTFNAIVPQWQGYIYDQTVDCGQPPYRAYYSIFGPLTQTLAQQPMSSPSVFNFYLPDYAPPGSVRDAGLVSPEAQIFNANTMQKSSKVISVEVFHQGEFGPDWIQLDLTAEAALADDTDALLEHLSLLTLSGQMSAGLRGTLATHLDTAPFPAGDAGRQTKARDAIILITNSPEYLIQK